MPEANPYLETLQAPAATGAGPGNPYLDLLQSAENLRKTQTAAAVSQAVGTNPDEFAKQKRVAAYLGYPLAAVAAMPDITKRQAQAQQVQQDIAASSVLQQRFTDADFARLAHDDTGVLSSLASAIGYLVSAPGRGNTLMGDIGAGVARGAQGAAGVFQAGAELPAPLLDWLEPVQAVGGNPLRRLAEGFATQGATAARTAERLSPPQAGTLAGGISSGVQSLTTNALALPLALFPGGQGAALSMVMAQTGGQSYQQAREQGLPMSQALPFAASQAAIEYATEKIPLARLIGDVKVSTPFFQTLAKQAALEVPGEQIATVLQDMNEWAILPENAGKSFKDYLAARPNAAAQTLIATLVGTGGNVTLTHALAKTFEGHLDGEAQQALAQQDAEQLKRVFDVAAQSALRERDPEGFATLVQELADEAPDAPKEVRFDGRQLVETLQQSGLPEEELRAMLPTAFAQLDEAMATGGEVTVPVGEFSKVIGTPLDAALMQHARIGDNELSQAESKQAGEQAAALLKTEAQRVAAQAGDEAAQRVAAEGVKTNVLDQLNTAGRFTPDVNNAYASLVRDFYVTMAGRLKTTPDELFKQFPLTVRAEGVGALEQPAYHGSPHRGIEQFTTQKIGTGEGAQAYGWGLYFAQSKDIAEFYRKALTAKLSDIRVTVNGRVRKGDPIRYAVEKLAEEQDTVTRADVVSYFERALAKPMPGLSNPALEKALRREQQKALDEARNAKSFDVFMDKKKGQLYTVEVPDDSDMLDYDASLKDQPEKVRKALEGLGFPAEQYRVPLDNGASAGLWNTLDEARKALAKAGSSGRIVSQPNTITGAKIYSSLQMRLGSDEAASRALFAAGIPGLRYLDAGSRGAQANNTTRNYVIFDDSAVKKTGELYQSAQQVDQTETPEFKRWFGKSKVVDENGKPLVVYHGTRNKFTTFDYSKIGDNGRAEGAGFYFTNNEQVASGYGEPLKVFLSIKKPLAYDAKGFSRAVVQKLVRRIAEREAEADGGDIADGFLSNFGDVRSEGLSSVVRQAADAIAADQTAVDQLSGIVGSGVNAEHVNRATFDVTGHDGVVAEGFSNSGDTDNRIFVAFFPEQIKSATDNRGTFDPSDPSILAQGPRGTFNPAALNITLLQDADLSTFLHETGHFFLDMLWRFANDPQAPADVQTDMVAVLKWFKTTPEQWAAWTEQYNATGKVPAGMRKQHERFAEGFEQYLLEGKAPSLELQPLFSKFRSWLLNVYKSLKDFLAGRGEAAGPAGALGQSARVRKLYHGTRAQFEELSTDFSNHNNEHGDAVYLTDSSDEAKKYGPRVLQRALAGEVLDEEAKPDADLLADLASELEVVTGRTISLRLATRASSMGTALEEIRQQVSPDPREGNNAINEALSALGYTARSYEEATGARSYAVWDVAGALGQSARDQTETPEFKRWFGDSKVVDERGKPLVVYHGTTGDFVEFKQGEAKVTDDTETPGWHFSASPDVASYYARLASDQANAEAENAIDEMNGGLGPMDSADQREAARLAPRSGANVLPVFLRIARPLVIKHIDQVGRLQDGYGRWRQDLLDRARRMHKYDGIILESTAGDSGKTEYIPFSAEQIKSAIGNRGAFDPNDPSILAQANQKTPLGLTDEVRGVFDRLLASQEQIARAEALRSFDPLKVPGMASAERAGYEAAGAKATDKALDTMSARSVKDMRWLSNARSKALKALQQDAAAKRKEVEAEVRAEVAKEPVRQAIRWLRKGEMTTAEGEQIRAEKGFRLNTEALAEMYPESMLARPDLEKLKGLTAGNGLHPDVVAGMFGFSSGDELVRSVIDAEPEASVVEGMTDQRMLERYGDLATEAGMQRAADEAVHNEARGRFLATGLKALQDAQAEKQKTPRGGSVSVMVRAAKDFAAQLVARRKVRELQAGQHTAAEARAGKAAQKALTKGDVAGAITAQRDQLLNHYAARETYAALDEVDKALAYLKKFDKDAVRKKLPPEYLDQIDKLLERVELRQRTLRELDKRAKLADWIKSQEDLGIEVQLPPEVAEDVQLTNYQDMTLEAFRGLVDTVKQVEHLGRLKSKLLTAKDQREFDAIKDSIVSSILANSQGRTADSRTPTTNLGRALAGVKNFGAAHIKVATWARVMDGGKDGGPVWEYLVRPANVAGDQETTMLAKATQDLAKILAPVLARGKMGGAGTFFPSIHRSMNREAVLAVALNTGNESNLQRLLGGEGWTADQITPMLDTLTPEDWKAVQAVWDYFESYRPLIAAKERRVFGTEPEWIEPGSAVAEAYGVKGGYYPVKYDPQASQRAEEHADAEGAKRQLQGAYGAATTRRSFTKARVDQVFDRPLLYTLQGVYSGVTDVIHDLAWHEWLIDANRLLKNKSIDAAIRNTYGTEVVRQFKSWRDDIADGGLWPQRPLDSALGYLRQSVSVAGLGFNVVNAMMQPLGLVQSIQRVGAKWVARGVWQTIGDPVQASKAVNEKSAFMANRARTRFRELNELRNRVQGQSALKRVVGENAYFLMMAFQRLVDVPTWQGAYERAISEGNDEARAVALADQAVIDAQGNGQTKDLAAIERGPQALKLFTTFYSFMNTSLNLGVASKMSPGSRAKFAADMLLLYMVPAVLGSVLKDAFTPGDAGDDEELAKKLAGEQLGYLLGLVVVGREFGQAGRILTGANAHDYTGPAGLRAISDAYQFAKQAGQGEFDDSFRKAAVNLAGDLLGLPSAQINRSITGVQALAEGKTQNPAAAMLGYQEPR